jgi:lysophospholipase
MLLVVTERDPVPEGAHADFLEAPDGTRFRVARFGRASARRGTVVILNGRTEFIEKYFEVIGDLMARGFAVATLDWRGQGRSDRALENPHKGHVGDFDDFVSDLRQAWIEFIEPHCPAPFQALCHSMGGNIGLRYLREYPDTFENAVFCAPMWGIGKPARVPGWMRLIGVLSDGLRLHSRYVLGGGDYAAKNRVFKGNALTQDRDRFERFTAQVGADPRLELGSPTFGWTKQAIRSMDVIHAEGFAEAIQTPLRIYSAARDTLVSAGAHRRVADRLPNGELVVVPDAKHEILMELDRYREQLLAAFDEA